MEPTNLNNKQNYTEQEQIQLIKENVNNIYIIANLCEAAKLTAISINPLMIASFKDPSMELIVAAHNVDGIVIQYFPDATEELKMIALRSNGFAILYIENPSETMINLAALSLSKRALCSADVINAREQIETRLSEHLAPELAAILINKIREFNHDFEQRYLKGEPGYDYDRDEKVLEYYR